MVTPGVNEDSDTTENLEPVAAIDIKMADDRKTKFSDDVPEVYGIHPKCIVATRNGWRRVSDNAHPFTGRSTRVMTKRRISTHVSTRMDIIGQGRNDAINAVHWYGAAWEQLGGIGELDLEYWYGSEWRTLTTGESSDGDERDEPPLDVVGAVRTASSKKKSAGQQGAKSVKNIEMEGNSNDLLSPERATTYRALSARGNFLAGDEGCHQFYNQGTLQRVRCASQFLQSTNQEVGALPCSPKEIGLQVELVGRC